MDYEKKYKDALIRAKEMIKIAINKDEAIGFANTIFPELKESEDERIKEDLIQTISQYTIFAHREPKDIIAWLEKQGDYNKLVEEIKERKELISKEKEKATSINDKLSLGERVVILEELLAFTKDWLKQLKPQPYWKPTDEQMEALDKVYKTHGADCECRHILLGLLNDLKKL